MAIISQVERSAMHRIVGWMKEIIQKEKLPFTVDADIELQIHGRRRKFPDILVFASYPNEIACLIEYKPPDLYDPYNPELVDDTYQEACEAPGTFYGTCRYFGTWNTNRFVLWDRKNYDASSYLDMRYKPYDVTNARNINDITRAIVEDAIKKFLREFLIELHGLYYEKRPIPVLPIDELFIYRLRTAVDTFFIPISEKIFREAKRKPVFKKRLRKWFAEQGWIFENKLDDYDRTARQYAYLIIDKVLFYNTLRLHKKKLEEIKLAKDITAEGFKRRLDGYFNKALDIDYEPIFSTNFLETIPLPDQVILQMSSFVNSLSQKYNFSKIGYEVIGRVFERLIPETERHKLGQYFTRSDIVDLINGFCVKSPKDTVLDPGCGAATFPIRAYALIKYMNPSKTHEELLRQLYGIDISKFAAHLSTINLCTRDLSRKENYPRIINADFFDVHPQRIIPRKYTVRKPSGVLTKIRIPQVDAVVGNPPYTRQEEMEDVFQAEYKKKLSETIKRDFGYSIGRRAGIYAYFFIHGAKFLKVKGRLGFVTSNSWLDVDYGKYLQDFFLSKYKIKAIVESKVERWFEDADVNTCITVLERCKTKEERENNSVKFTQLKIPLRRLVPVTNNEKKRFGAIRKLIKVIEKTDKFYEDDKIRIFPKNQKELYQEGFDEVKNKYVGSKWGKYLRAPEIFFKIVDKSKDLSIPLKQIAEVKRGFTTGTNEFFYLTEDEIKKLGIEKEFWMHKAKGKWIPNYVIKGPRECKGIIVNRQDFKYRVLMIHKSKQQLKETNILKYVRWGEEQGFHERPTCASRKRWYDLGIWAKPDIIWSDAYSNRFASFDSKNTWADKRFFCVYLKNKRHKNLLLGYLNSSIIGILVEIDGITNLGQGAVYTNVYWLRKLLPILNRSKLSKSQIQRLERAYAKLSQRSIGSVFEEIGTDKPEDVSLDKVKKDRTKLDEVVFDLLGLSEKEQLDVYRAVVDLVRSRIERAKSVKKKNKKGKFDVSALADDILQETKINELKKFPDEYVSTGDFREMHVPEGGQVEVESDLFHGIHVKVGEEVIKCKNYDEASYIKYAILNGNRVVRIPNDENVLKKATKEYGKLLNEIKTKAEKTLDEFVPDKKIKEQVRKEIIRKIFTRNRGG